MVIEKTSLKELQSILRNNGFKTIILNNENEVNRFIHSKIPNNSRVGLGNSITTCKLNIRNFLYAKGSIIFYSWDGSEGYNRSLDTFESSYWPEYYLTRLTALTLSGEILIKDYSKQSAEAGKFPEKVYAFMGTNRIVERFNNAESISKYPILAKCPQSISFTIALLPFLDY